MDKTTMRSKQIRVKVYPEEDEMFQELKRLSGCTSLAECIRKLVSGRVYQLKNGEKIIMIPKTLESIFHMIANMPIKEFDELLWKYYLSDIKQNEYKEIEKEIYEEDAKFKNELMASNFANFKPKSPSKRKSTQNKRKKKSTAKKHSKKSKTK